jgi:hypothetical protein
MGLPLYPIQKFCLQGAESQKIMLGLSYLGSVTTKATTGVLQFQGIHGPPTVVTLISSGRIVIAKRASPFDVTVR